MKKVELRKLAMARRKNLSAGTLADLSRKLVDRFAQLDLSDIKTVHIFLPIAEKKEPDTFLLIDWLRAEHPAIKIIVPRADFENTLMTSHVYDGRDDLVRNLYNILEPQKSDLHTGDVDLVLVPLLAFDQRGFRVGYGKGFYDRFLEPLNCKKIGLSLFDAVDFIEDVHENDIRLDACITPEKTYWFK